MVHPSEQHALELVVFKLKDGTSREAFLATVGAVSDWAATQPGFVSRDLSYDASGDRWIDVVYWRSLAAAEAAAAVAESSPSCAGMFELIDLESMLMIHGQSGLAAMA